jgi:hypothetical protein
LDRSNLDKQPDSNSHQRYVIDQAGRASSDVITKGDSGINEGQRGSVDAGAKVAAVGLKNFDKNVDLGPEDTSIRIRVFKNLKRKKIQQF